MTKIKTKDNHNLILYDIITFHFFHYYYSILILRFIIQKNMLIVLPINMLIRVENAGWKQPS